MKLVVNTNILFSFFRENNMFVEVKSIEFFEEFKAESEQISPHAKDAPFFALALKLDSDIWSNEPRLKRQSRVKVYNTGELRKLLEKPKEPEPEDK